MQIYQEILNRQTVRDALNYRTILTIKSSAANKSKSRLYQENIATIDNGLQQIFNAAYTGICDDVRIADLICFWNAIE